MVENPSEAAVTAATLVHLLQWRARTQPNERVYTFLPGGEADEAHLTYAELDRQARMLGARLQNLEAAGQRVLLLYPPGLDYIAAFFGCLYSGAIPVPAYPPRLNRPVPRLQAIVADAGATLAISTAQILSSLQDRFSHAPELARLHWLATDELSGDDADRWQALDITGDSLAFIQYTSGSTSTPKGVMLTHRNLLHNLAAIHTCFGVTTNTQGVIWLPPYHDMGLIGGILEPLYGGFPVTLMPPVAFLERPLRWLQAITHYGGTCSGGPNFAYDLCVDKISPEQRARLDLSTWEVAFNGAEPIRRETIERFTRAFAPCGFRVEAFYPCYGLAEATLIVSGGLKELPPVPGAFEKSALERNQVAVASIDEEVRELVSSGRTLADQNIVIVDPNAFTRCAPDQVGEIWVSGPSVARGYWNQPEDTRRTFQAYLAESGEGPFLRTGDLGFLKDGELFVTGRLKDLLIIRGRNHYPQDIEQTVEGSHPALRPAGGAAFSIEVNDEERLVVAQEVQPSQRKTLDADEVARAIRQAVFAEHELQVYAVVLLKAGSIPKTSSGKIQRSACRAGYLDNSLNIIARSNLAEEMPKANRPAGEPSFIRRALAAVQDAASRQTLLTLYLQEKVASALRVTPAQLASNQPLSGLGIDSLAAISLKNTIESDLDVNLPLAFWLEGGRLADLVAQVTAQLETPQVSTAIAPSGRDVKEFPLSKGQEALWFMHRLTPDSAVHNIAHAVRIRSDLDVAALKRAFQTLVDRHPALRTTFHADQGKPAQRIHDRLEIHFQHETVDGDEATLNDCLIAQATRPFDLERGPLLRLYVFSRSTREHVLLLVAHHIAVDLWSMAMLVHEIGLLYAASQADRPAKLPDLQLQYGDYVYWQAERLNDLEGERLWAYWQERLSGELPVLNLPADRPRPPVQRHRGATYHFKLTPKLSERIKSLAHAEGATLYAFLLAAYQVFLFRYTGQPDIIVGSPATGRSQAQLSDLVGYFVNLIPLRASLTGALPFRSFLEQTRRDVIDALAHQDFPFALLVERLQPQRDLSYSPIFQTVFAWQQAPLFGDKGLAALAAAEGGVSLEVGGLHLETIALETQVAQFDLMLTMAESERGLVAALEYNADLFDAATVARMAGHWQALLESIVADPGASLSQLPLLREEERRELLANSGVAPIDKSPSSDACLHQIFESQATQASDAIALVFEGEHLTYEALNRRANQLAHHLHSMGVRLEARVALCLNRSIDMVAAILGVLKAGGAYVPLDPAYPKERLAFMLADSGAHVAITQHALIDLLAPHVAQTVCLDTDWPVILHSPFSNRHSSFSADNLAYAIYTSGSTGQPKGTLICHRNVVQLFEATDAAFGFDASDVWTLFHSYAFDFSVWELWGALLYGGRLVGVPYWVSRSPEAFYELLLSERVTILNQTPSAFRSLSRVDAVSSEFRSLALRRVIFGGEALEIQSLKPWFERHGDGRPQLVNMYGITETTVHVTYRPLTEADATAGAGSDIGAPIPGVRVYLLDPASLQPVPIGVRGEMYVGGPGLGRGYLNRPELTAERFVPNPFTDDCSPATDQSAVSSEQSSVDSRLYRTGDLARRLANGNLEYLGRIDTQVKIRGFRIELAEIEAALRAHPAIQDAAVVMREAERQIWIAPSSDPIESKFRLHELRRFLKGASSDRTEEIAAYGKHPERSGGRSSTSLRSAQNAPVAQSKDAVNDLGNRSGEPSTDKQLVAYLVWNESAPSLNALRQFLKERLPEYMLPAAFVSLDRLPLTLNGKLDQRALPAPDQSRPDLDEPFVAPRTPTEEALASAWKQVLGLERIGIDDNYFALGGDSIRSLQVQALARSSGLSFSLPDLFRFQTIRELATVVERLEAGPNARVIDPFDLISETDRSKLPAGVEDAYPLSRIQAGVIFHTQLRPDSPMYRDIFFYRLRAPLDLDRFQAAIQRLIDRHAIFRTAFHLTGFSEPLQLVYRRVQASLEVAELRAMSIAEQETWQAVWIETEKSKPFDWAAPPLIRFFIHRLTDDTFYFVISFHDVILDGWSTALMLVEILQGYAALLAEKPPAAQSPPAIAYRDYVALERQTIETPANANYWAEKLKGWTFTPLPRRVAPIERAPQMGVLDVPIPADVSDGLKGLARLARVPLKHVLLAAHLRVMSLLGGGADVLTGLESNGRLEEVDGERAIGIHLNTVPFRQRLDGGTWLELARQSFDTERELWPFRRYPYAEIQRREGGRPMFETAFNYTHFHAFKNLQALKDIEVVDAKGFGQTHFTLKAEFNQDPFSDRVQLDLECNLAVLDRTQLEIIGGYYANVLSAMARESFGRYEHHSPLSGEEQRRLLIDWNDTAADYPLDRCLHELFESQAARTPDAIAILFEERWITYQALNLRANQLAHHLRASGIEPGSTVCLCVERSPEMVVGMLGILKAGGAYVPLDPNYPRERLAFMLADAQPQVLLTHSTLVERLPNHSARVICLDTDWSAIRQSPISDLQTPTSPDSPAYVIYTSGSTGQPKGAIGLHRGAVNRFQWMWDAYPFDEGEVCCQKTSLSFVDAVWEVLGPLLHGVSTVIIPDPVIKDLPQFVQALAERHVTRIVLVPSLLRTLLETELNLQHRLPELKHWIVSGEALSVELAERFRERLPGRNLINLYGSSEVSADVTCYATPERMPFPSVPIGRPIANTQIYILDAHLQPVSIGVPGELYVGGAGLAQGYLNRPDLTAERFVPTPPFSPPSSTGRDTGGGRLYKTGDLARYLPDGDIEYLGRLDHQEKIRGYRIELGEIENVLSQHPAVREAVVVAHGHAGDKRLAAYVVADRASQSAAKSIDFSLFYFAADEAASQADKYRLYVETAKFADAHGFSAVWTPERHFHAVGGLYPNPATLSAALAMVTERIHLRAGSVVLPLQHPVRVAEEWAVVDNLSNGRAGIAVAPGWVPNDFAFFPDHFAQKRDVMFQGIDQVRRLWRGEPIDAIDGVGNPTSLRIFPRPIQPELPLWITCNRGPELFEKAGELGANVLTALLSQNLDELTANIERYRDALARHGHNPKTGRVTLMLHTFVADTEAEVLAKARDPFCNYILAHVGLIETWLKSLNLSVDLDREKGLADLAAFAFERYYQTASLIGTPDSCRQMIDRLLEIGVDEVGCLIDFGLDFESVMHSLHRLSEFRQSLNAPATPDARSLQNFLKAKLPDYMLPSTFVLLESLPLTPNGKVDRRALPEPVALPAAPRETFAPPGTPTQKALAEIWRDVLQVERVGIHDDFFELGGHSLKATQLMSLVRQRFGLELSVQHIFTAPTIKNMAGVVDEAILARASSAKLNQLLDAIEGMGEDDAQEALNDG